MLDVHRAFENPTVLRTLTGLNPDEFTTLAQTFAEVWAEHTRLNWQGQPRQRAAGGGRPTQLDRAEQKLFFILYYLRHYPIQAVLGFWFGMDQPQANKWILRLLPLLRQALERHCVLPHRGTADLEQVLADCKKEMLHLDGTERPIRRPQDPDHQKACYSGRKKRHTVKNLVVSHERTVKYLSPTVPGSQSDKRLAEPLEQVAFPKKSILLTDLGFLGLVVPVTTMAQPTKKPKGGELSPFHQQFNRMLAGIRVKVEHVLSGIKRCRIVSDPLRHMKADFEDLVMEVASGLHNFRESYRQMARPGLLPVQLN